MEQNTFNEMQNKDLYKHSAVPFIDKLLLLNIPLSAINTNDFYCTTMPRVYVTREYGREKGGKSRKAHLMQFGHKSAERLSKFYHS